MNILNGLAEVLAAGVGLYWTDAVVILVVSLALAFLYKNGRRQLVYSIVYDLVVKAEKVLGSGTGELKYQFVVAQLYRRLPLTVRALFTDKELDYYIEEAVKALKTYLVQGKNLNGYISK